MIALSQEDLKSYEEKYNQIQQKRIKLSQKKIKSILMDQFSLTEHQTESIIKKVFASKTDELGKQGFFKALKYVQCIQNDVDIENCDIEKILLKNKLRVKRAKNQIKLDEDPLVKSQNLVDQLQCLKNKSKLMDHEKQFKSQMIQSDQISEGDLRIEQFSIISQESKIHEEQPAQNVVVKDAPEFLNCIEHTQAAGMFQGSQDILETQGLTQVKPQAMDEHNPKISDLEAEPINQFRDNQVSAIKQSEQSNQVQQNDFKLNQHEPLPKERPPVVPIEIHRKNAQENEMLPKIDERPDFIEIDDSPRLEQNQKISDTSDKYYEVALTSFQYVKKSTLSKGHYECTVITILTQKEEGMEDLVGEVQVDRRYKDFEMLQQYFIDNRPGKIIPKLPEKDNMVGFFMKFITEPQDKLEQRRVDLEIFLRQIIQSFREELILEKFLLEKKKFSEILKQMREELGEDENNLPNPEDYTIQANVTSFAKRLTEMSVPEATKLIKEFLKSQPILDEAFSSEFEQINRNYEIIQSKYRDLCDFEQSLLKFYAKKKPWNYNQRSEECIIVNSKNKELMLQVQNVYGELDFKQHNRALENVMTLKKELENVFFTYNQIVKQVSKWSFTNLRLRQTRALNAQDEAKQEGDKARLKNVLNTLQDQMRETIMDQQLKLSITLDTLTYQLTSI